MLSWEYLLTSQWGNTYLHIACLGGHADVISLLLERGRGIDLLTRNKVCLSSCTKVISFVDREGKLQRRCCAKDQKKKFRCLTVLETFKTVE
jgi:ankyrin repeat protein